MISWKKSEKKPIISLESLAKAIKLFNFNKNKMKIRISEKKIVKKKKQNNSIKIFLPAQVSEHTPK